MVALAVSARAPDPASPRAHRTNADWLAALRSMERVEREPAVAELSAYVRAGLAKALLGSSNVVETDLDDFTQDALVRILGGLDSFRGDSRLTTWAMAVAIRTAYTTLRRRRSAHVSLTDLENLADLDSPAAGSPAPADLHVERNALLEALYRAIFERLTERQRTVVLAELKGIASERVADLLGTNRNALYKVYHDARRNLRRALKEAGFDREDARELLERVN
jgi:RNA polymerase sigma-70 factor (ECF subfamily)